MSKLMQGIERFWREEEGTEVVEWALVCGLLVAVGAVVFVAIGDQAEQALQAIVTMFSNAGYAPPAP